MRLADTMSTVQLNYRADTARQIKIPAERVVPSVLASFNFNKKVRIIL